MWGGAHPERLWTLMPLPRRLRELRGKHGGRGRNLPSLEAPSEGRRSHTTHPPPLRIPPFGRGLAGNGKKYP